MQAATIWLKYVGSCAIEIIDKIKMAYLKSCDTETWRIKVDGNKLLTKSFIEPALYCFLCAFFCHSNTGKSCQRWGLNASFCRPCCSHIPTWCTWTHQSLTKHFPTREMGPPEEQVNAALLTNEWQVNRNKGGKKTKTEKETQNLDTWENHRNNRTQNPNPWQYWCVFFMESGVGWW